MIHDLAEPLDAVFGRLGMNFPGRCFAMHKEF
jgi:hypothetical protein